MKIYFTILEYKYLYLFIACKDKRFFPYHQIIFRFFRIITNNSHIFLPSMILLTKLDETPLFLLYNIRVSSSLVRRHKGGA